MFNVCSPLVEWVWLFRKAINLIRTWLATCLGTIQKQIRRLGRRWAEEEEFSVLFVSFIFLVDESSVSLIQINSWAMLNQYLLQNKHASISSFQGRIFKRSRQTTFCLDPSPGFFSYVWLWLTMSICVVWPVSNHHHLIMRSHGHYSPLPPVGPKIWTKAFSSPCLAYPSCTLWTARWGKEAQNLRRTWLFWCNSLFCLRRCWGVMIKHVYQIISVYPIPVDVFWWSSAVCVDSNQVFFLAS